MLSQELLYSSKSTLSMNAKYMPGATAVGITYIEGEVFASERRID